MEREEEMRTFINLGVRYGQGLFIGRPESLNADQATVPRTTLYPSPTRSMKPFMRSSLRIR